MDWVRYLLDKEDFLGCLRKEFHFASGSALTLWDILWQEYSDSQCCSGKLHEYIEKEYEYVAEQSKEGGDYRDQFVDWLGYCDHCGRGKKLTPEKEEELREEYARSSIDDDLNCHMRGESERAKKRKSKFLVPARFDWIDDPDDDIGVSIALGLPEYDKQQKAKLAALGKKKARKQIQVRSRTLDEHEFWLRVYTAGWLVSELEAFAQEREEQLIAIDRAQHMCGGCGNPLIPDMDGVEYSREAYLGKVIPCQLCGDSVSMRAARATAAAFLDQPGGDWLYTKAGKRLIHTNTPALPFESGFDPSTSFVTRVEPMQYRLLRRRLEELCKDSEFWSIGSSDDQLDDGVPLVYHPGDLPESEGGYGWDAVSMTIYVDGVVRIGARISHYSQGADEEMHPPRESDVLLARAALVQAGFKEYSEEVVDVYV